MFFSCSFERRKATGSLDLNITKIRIVYPMTLANQLYGVICSTAKASPLAKVASTEPSGDERDVGEGSDE